MKKEVGKIIFILILLVFLSSGIFAVTKGTCDIVERDSCDDPYEEGYIVMGLSDSTNAHGQEWDATPFYSYVLCCNLGGGNRVCSSQLHPIPSYDGPENKIVGLSSLTNAHVEAPQEDSDNYEDVCYDELTCVNIELSCDEDDYPMEVASLSGYTNAHIGNFENYDTKICCKKSECEEMECMGESICSAYVYENDCKCDPCGVGDDNPPGDTNCEDPNTLCYCWWDGSTGCSRVVEEYSQPPSCGDGVINSGETCEGDDLGLITGCDNSGGTGHDDCTGGTISCYPPGHDEECTLDVSECIGCNLGGICGDDPDPIIQSPNNDGVYETCDGNDLNGKTCEDFSLLENGLACYPPTHANNCTFDTTGCELGEGGHPSKIGKCSYDENTDDDCEDKFLTYNWTATWTWDEDNPEHDDPNNAAEKCVDGSNTVPCPAQIQLPFFGNYSIVMIISLIALIYIFLKFKEKEKGKSSKRKVKKK